MTVVIEGSVVNEADIYECEACEHIDAVCAYHLGVSAGVSFVAAFLADFGADPEVYLHEARKWKRVRDREASEWADQVEEIVDRDPEPTTDG